MLSRETGFTISRRNFVGGLIALSLLPPLEKLQRFFPDPEAESIPLEPGDIVLTENGQRYLIKQELEGGKLVLRRYQIPDFDFWKAVVGYRGQEKEINQAALGDIPKTPVPQETEVPHWDGRTKNHSPDGGIKFIPISGVHTKTGDNTFGEIKKALGELGFSEADILDPTYRVDRQKPLLGLPYDRKNSTQDPQKSLANMNRLLYLWKKQFPLEKFWLLGHSQGGWVAYELARQHPDAIAGVITLDGALKGAKVTPLPTPAESIGAGLILGEAGKFFVERSDNDNLPSWVENEVKKLQQKGVVFVSFASTDDDIVRPQYALVGASNKNFAGREIELKFPMGSWIEWDTTQEVVKLAGGEKLKLDFDSPEAGRSAQLVSSAGRSVGRHGAVLANPKVLEYVKLIISSQINVQELKKKRFLGVVSVFPSPGARDISRWPDIEVVFNRKVLPGEIIFTVVPFFPVEILTEEEAQKTGDSTPPNELIYVPNQKLEKTTTYKITLKLKFGEEYSWTFTTTEVEAGAVKGWGRGFRQQQRIYEAAHPPQEVDIINNIVSKILDTPNKMYQGDGFRVSYASRGEVFSVDISCEEPYEVIEKRAKEWFREQGWDLIKVLPKPKIEWYSTCSLPPHVMLP